MNEEFRYMVIEALRRGDELPTEWAQLLFPPEKREYELVYYGKEREEDILANTLGVPLQPMNIIGDIGEGWHNMLIFGNNLQTLKTLLERKNQGLLTNSDGSPGVRLIYIDPPFGTGDEYGGAGKDEIAYSAKMRGVQFIEFLRKRLVLLRELLADDGTIWVRLDYHFGHYIKVIMDEIFQEQNFQNEIVINRVPRRLRNLNKFNVRTESIFLYSKSGNFFLNTPEMPRVCNYCGRETEPIWDDLTSPGLRNPPERTFLGTTLLPRRGRHFTYTQEKIDEMIEHGRIRMNDDIPYFDLNGQKIEARPEYLQTEGFPVDTNWTDLRGYAFGTGYPTENHEELLERVILSGSKEGDIVLDAFAGSGTTGAVSEKLNRRWISIDAGKYSVYTIQKRMLNLRASIGNRKGERLIPKPFVFYSAGLYDFSTLRQLPWEDWRFFALQLFGCKDEPHTIGGMKLDGKRQGSSVLVFNHLAHPGKLVDEQTISSIHTAIGQRIGAKFFIIAPRNTFDFQQDFIDLEGVRYYALRIPYSFINELHHREFTALEQPKDETAVNEIIDAYGFDFIRPPKVTWTLKLSGREKKTPYLYIEAFQSRAYVRGKDTLGAIETLSMVMLDFDYNGNVFDLDAVFYAQDLEKADWRLHIPLQKCGRELLIIFIDVYGNEARELIARERFDELLGSSGPKQKEFPN